MKYGINTLVWTTHISDADHALFARIRGWGFDGVELFLSAEEPADISSVRRMLDGLELERTACCVLSRETNLVSPQPEVRAQGVAYLQRCVERTAELGGRLLCGPMYSALGVMTGSRRTADEWQWAVEGLQAVARQAQQLEVMLCIEPLNRFETYFLNTLSDAARLVHSIGEPNVGIHFDTFHANIEERHPAEALRAVAKDLKHVHFSENDRGTPGAGHNDWWGIMTALKETGYNEWVTIESFAQPEPGLAAAAAIWRDLAPSGDELARNGLQFIKNLSRELGMQ
ncbi:MAG: sugar phosphate isomerase/epimerase family protein [Terriglobia bacterium]